MCVRMCLYVFVCIYIYVSLSLYLSIYLSLSIYIYICIYIYIYIYIDTVAGREALRRARRPGRRASGWLGHIGSRMHVLCTHAYYL